MPNKPLDEADAVFTPSEVSTYTQQWIKNLAANQNRSVQIGIPTLRDYFAPLMPGQLCSVIAQTTNYKSGFLHSWERSIALDLMKEGREDEIVIHVSVEESVEEQGILQLSIESGEDSESLARGQVQDWGKLMQAAIHIGVIPIYRIGDALSRAEDMPNLYVSNMIRAIEYIQGLGERKLLTWTPKIAAIFFDYLQAFPFDPEHRVPGNDQRRLQVRDDIYHLRQAAHKFNCPVIVAVQAKQHLEGAPSEEFYMPGIYDGEESASIGQRSDRILTLWMPKTKHRVGKVISIDDGHKVAVDENLIFIKVAKQRGRLPSGKAYQCRINFQDNLILEESNYEGR